MINKYVVCISVPRDNGKTKRKEMPKLFSRDYDHNERFGEMSGKCEFYRDRY